MVSGVVSKSIRVAMVSWDNQSIKLGSMRILYHATRVPVTETRWSVFHTSVYSNCFKLYQELKEEIESTGGIDPRMASVPILYLHASGAGGQNDKLQSCDCSSYGSTQLYWNQVEM